MNNNITIGAHTYLQTAPNGSGASVRIDASTGLNTPTELQIRQTPYKEAKSRLPGHLSTVRIAKSIPVRGGVEMQIGSVTVSFRVPLDAGVDYDDVSELMDRAIALLGQVSLREEIFKSRLA